jgi:hypothetical protein
MTVAGASSYDGNNDAESRIEVIDNSGNLPPPANLELADSVLNRLEPKDRHEMGQMIHSRSVMGGILFAAVGIFWWLTVSVIGNTLGDTDPELPASMIFNLGFFHVSLLIPLLVLIATVLLMHSRERSSWESGLIGGILLIIALYFTLEPLGWIVFTDQGSPSMVLQSLRIGALAIMVHFASHMLLDAILLSWVQKMLQKFPLELSTLDEPLLLGSGDFDKDEEEVSPA